MSVCCRMGRHPISVGVNIFPSKSKALEYFRGILNSYEAGDKLGKDDFKSVHDLACRNYDSEELIEYENDEENLIKFIVVDYHPEFKSTKCFFLITRAEEEYVFSYRLAINGALSDRQRFSNACRFLVSSRLRDFKKQHFKNRPVKCAMTNKVVEWEECQVDHKSPLTFSVIVKSFIIANNIDVSSVEYSSEYTKEHFVNKELAEKFDFFHKEMAVLRILSTGENNKLSANARIKPTKKDGVL